MKKLVIIFLAGAIAFVIFIVFVIFSLDFIFMPTAESEKLLETGQSAVQTEEKVKTEDEARPEEKQARNFYNIRADYDGKNKFQCEMEFTYIDKSGELQSELYFHLYPNIFNNRERLPFFMDEFNRIFPQGFSSGGIFIQSISQEDRDLAWELLSEDQILKVSLLDPSGPEDSVKLNFKFSLSVPNANYRYGYQLFGGDKITLALAHWYPMLAMYDDEGWVLDTHQALGDVTYSDVADFEVRFTVPVNFEVAASGALIQKDELEQRVVYCYRGEKIRDFAASISNNYESCETVVDGVKLISYFHPEDRAGGLAALDIAGYALHIYNEMFGYYPYPELRIAESNFYGGGMEYPNFIIMNTARYKEPNLSNKSFERSMAHEVAHQWWYGLVGNDQINEPWLDEGLAEFSTMCYFERRYGKTGWETYYNRYVVPYKNIFNKSKRTIWDKVSDFTRSEYFPIIYVKGGLYYREIRERIGEEELLDILRHYLETYKYKNVDFDEFWRFWDERGHGDLFREIYNSSL